jgi:hypothetical protein
MNVRLPQRKQRVPRKPPIAPGDRRPPDDAGGTELPLPHERDQATGQTEPEPQRVIEQAKADIDAGLVDTDMRATPGLDAERRDELVSEPLQKRK